MPMTTSDALHDAVLLTIDGTPFPLAQLRGGVSVVVLMRHLA